jgi:GH25 family lysozyme M1 (1,4-beta-N-acetylmuramidase)
MNLGWYLKVYQPSTRAKILKFLAPTIVLARALQPLLSTNDRIIPDTSFWEGVIDYRKMMQAGAVGTIIRAGEGDWEDIQFQRSRAQASAQGMRWASYWFLDSRFSPTAQARKYSEILGDDPGEFLVVDYESPDDWNGKYAGWRSLYDFIEELRTLRPGMRIVIYTGDWYWYGHSPNPYTEKASLAWFGQFDLWLARYADVSQVTLFAPWNAVERIAAWQFTGTGDGQRYGTESLGVDLSYGYTMFSGSEPTEPPPPTGDEMEVKAFYKISIRAGHSTASAILGDFPKDAIAQVSETWETGSEKGVDYEQWAHIEDGWVAVWYRNQGTGGKLCELTGTLPVPSADPVTLQIIDAGQIVATRQVQPGSTLKVEISDDET